MSNTSYWTEGEYEYAFLVPQGNIDESYKRKLLAVLKEFDKTLYVRSDSNSSGWEEVQKTAEMPELENEYEKTGWTLSSEQNILSDKGMLEKLEKNLKGAGCSCSFMVIDDGPEEEIEGNSEVNLEAEDSGQPSLDETPQQTDEVEKKSGRKKKNKKQKSKKSTKVKVGNGTQTNTIRELKERSASAKASKDRKLTPYKVISNTNNDENKVKEAWKAIGSFIKTNAETYKDVKPVGYGDKKHWHNWHKSWVGKNFVLEDGRKFWLIKLNDDLKNKLEKNLKSFDFELVEYKKINDPPVSESNIRASIDSQVPLKNGSENVLNIRGLPLGKTAGLKSDAVPGVTSSNELKSQTENAIGIDALTRDIKKGVGLRNTGKTRSDHKSKEVAADYDVDGLRSATEQRRQDILENIPAGNQSHPIAKILEQTDPGKFILGLKLAKPSDDVLKSLDGKPMCDDNVTAMLIKNTKSKKGLDASNWIDKEDYEEYMLNKNKDELGWLLLIDSNLKMNVPSENELEALSRMKTELEKIGLKLVKVDSDGRIADSSPKTNGGTNKTPKKFFGLEDNVTTQGKSGKSRILVLVRYSDIANIQKNHPEKKVRDVSKGIYKEFNPEKLAKVLDDFNKTNGVLKPLMLKGSRGTGQPNAGGYKTVLASPVKQDYKNTGEVVSTWNLIISKPDGTKLNQAEIQKIIELVKILKDHGVAVRREKDLKLQ